MWWVRTHTSMTLYRNCILITEMPNIASNLIELGRQEYTFYQHLDKASVLLLEQPAIESPEAPVHILYTNYLSGCPAGHFPLSKKLSSESQSLMGEILNCCQMDAYILTGESILYGQFLYKYPLTPFSRKINLDLISKINKFPSRTMIKPCTLKCRKNKDKL